MQLWVDENRIFNLKNLGMRDDELAREKKKKRLQIGCPIFNLFLYMYVAIVHFHGNWDPPQFSVQITSNLKGNCKRVHMGLTYPNKF